MYKISGICSYCSYPMKADDYPEMLEIIVKHLNLAHFNLDLGFLIIGGILRLEELGRVIAEQVLKDIQIKEQGGL